jgi:hypothetical protein
VRHLQRPIGLAQIAIWSHTEYLGDEDQGHCEWPAAFSVHAGMRVQILTTLEANILLRYGPYNLFCFGKIIWVIDWVFGTSFERNTVLIRFAYLTVGELGV